MREDVMINAEGVALAGWFYRPETEGPWPAVVMAHGFAGVKELHLDRFARVFRDAGLAVLVFDHRNFGGSEGEPRQEIDPWAQVRDYRHAITWLQSRTEVDPKRIGIWGTSFAGGHVLVVSAFDARVRCVVSQVPAITGSGALSRRDPAANAALAQAFAADRANRALGAVPMTLQVYPIESGPAAMSGDGAIEHYRQSLDDSPAPEWRNAVTLRSLEMASEYEPGDYVSRIAPRPLLMIVAENDQVTPSDFALAAYGRAGEPKKLLILVGARHFDVYRGEAFDRASAASRDFLLLHLSGAQA